MLSLNELNWKFCPEPVDQVSAALLPQPRRPVGYHHHGQIRLLAAFRVQHQKSLAVAGQYAKIWRAKQQARTAVP